MEDDAVLQKIERELDLLRPADFLPKEGQKWLFPALQKDDEVMGECPQSILGFFILALKKRELLSQKTEDTRFSVKDRRDIRAEYDLCIDVFWEALARILGDEKDMAIRENGTVVKERKPTREEALEGVFNHLESVKKRVLSKYN